MHLAQRDLGWTSVRLADAVEDSYSMQKSKGMGALSSSIPVPVSSPQWYPSGLARPNGHRDTPACTAST